MNMPPESDDQSLQAANLEPMSQDEQMTPAQDAETDAASTETAVAPITDETTPILGTDSDDSSMVAQSNEPPSKKKPSTKKRIGKPSLAHRKNLPTLQQVTDRFAACGRCSYFWAGYKVIFGAEALATAVSQSQSGWLNLEWNLQMPELVHKSYGIRLDITHFHYEGCCKECHRPFVYQAADVEDEADNFQIGITPRVSP